MAEFGGESTHDPEKGPTLAQLMAEVQETTDIPRIEEIVETLRGVYLNDQYNMQLRVAYAAALRRYDEVVTSFVVKEFGRIASTEKLSDISMENTLPAIEVGEVRRKFEEIIRHYDEDASQND